MNFPSASKNIMTWRPEAEIVKPEEKSIARQRLCKHIPTEANARNNRRAVFPVVHTALVVTQRCGKHISEALTQHATMDEEVFSVGDAPKLYNEDLRQPASRKRRQKGKSLIWDSKIWSRVPRDSDPKMTRLAKASTNCKWQTHPVVRKDVI
jgi:hypothetical protein